MRSKDSCPVLRGLRDSNVTWLPGATRLGDDEAYWPDGGASADLFDEF